MGLSDADLETNKKYKEQEILDDIERQKLVKKHMEEQQPATQANTADNSSGGDGFDMGSGGGFDMGADSGGGFDMGGAETGGGFDMGADTGGEMDTQAFGDTEPAAE